MSRHFVVDAEVSGRQGGKSIAAPGTPLLVADNEYAEHVATARFPSFVKKVSA